MVPSSVRIASERGVEVDVGDGAEGPVADPECGGRSGAHRTRSPRLEGEVADVEGRSGDRCRCG